MAQSSNYGSIATLSDFDFRIKRNVFPEYSQFLEDNRLGANAENNNMIKYIGSKIKGAV